MTTFQIVFVIAGLNVGVMGWMILERERRIAAAWRRVRSTLDLERSKPLLDRCYDLLMAHYGADTFAVTQLEVTPAAGRHAPGAFEALAESAAARWQVTLPPIRFRLVPGGRREVAGTYGMTEACGATVGEERAATLNWSETHEIGVAGGILGDADALVVVVAHEVSHLVLGRDRVTTGNRSDDEILTDVATALVGYGALMRRLKARTIRRAAPGRQLSWSISGPGYLHPEELDYVLARRARELPSSH